MLKENDFDLIRERNSVINTLEYDFLYDLVLDLKSIHFSFTELFQKLDNLNDEERLIINNCINSQLKLFKTTIDDFKESIENLTKN